LFKETEFNEISNLLGEGFFADRVVSILQKPGIIDSTSNEVLSRVKYFLKKVLEGQEQVKSSSLSSDTVESIDAYQRAMIAFRTVLTKKSEDVTKAKFKELINQMDDEVNSAIENKCIAPDKVETTLDFFKFVSRETLVESSEFFTHRVVLKWPQRMLFHRF